MYSQTTDRERIYEALSSDIFLNIYAVGDLDDFFWNNTRYFINPLDDSIILLYRDGISSVVHAINRPARRLEPISQEICGLFPAEFYAHITKDYKTMLAGFYDIKSHGPHYKMGLKDRSKISSVDTDGVIILTPDDAGELKDFYDKNFPGNWFNPRMLVTNKFFGVKENGTIVAASGVHVYSEAYKVAAIGGVATGEKHRRRGLATKIVAAQCRELFGTVEHIGLNVFAYNEAAIECYQKLGFEIIGEYEEAGLKKSL